ncbi:MAG: 3-oxoacid CoA-transferase [Gammaproteobacteria bacterium]|nr:3-oxoacid CoA-transferase [Gammaproteobacteria bacterium]
MREVPQLSVEAAAAKVQSGDTLVVGGFGMTGYPVHLVHALADLPTNDLTYIGNNVGEPGLGGGRLVRNGQIKKAIGSYFTTNREVVEAWQAGDLECQLLPQGTLSEAIRAAGAGLGGFYTPTGAGTALAEGRETRTINGVEMLLVEPLPADVALIRAWRADTAGNLQYRLTENNFNQAAATAATLVLAEVEEIVPVGELDPAQIHTPGCYVDFLVQATLDVEELGTSASIHGGAKKVDETRMLLALAALAELSPGEIVNLGVGVPTLVADLITPEHRIVLHTENGMLGVGPAPASGGAMEYPVNASKIPVTALPGSCYFDSAESFAMIRGRHVDVAVLGGLQVDQQGNLANWAVPGKPLLGVGGAMDLASGAGRVIVLMTHCDKEGASKVVPTCTLPLTACTVVDTLITELAIFRFDANGMVLTALMPGVSVEQVRAATTAQYREDL